MKFNLKTVGSLFMIAMLSSAISQSVGATSYLSQVAIFTALFAFSFASNVWSGAFNNAGIFKYGIEPEIWHSWLAENIYKNNQFIANSVDVSDSVLGGAVVHIPQSGAASSAEKNRSSLPATITKRTDTDRTYPLDEYTTDPRRVAHTEQIEASYDKMDSVFKDDTNALRQLVAEHFLYAWGTTKAANIKRTTGDAVLAHLPSATGNRKKLTEADFRTMMTLANSQDIPQDDGRVCLLSSQLYDQLIESLSQTQYADFSKYYDAEKGIVGKLHGWTVMQRSSVLKYDNEATPVKRAVGAAGATTDNDAAIFWHKDYVERAMGEIKVFEDPDNPTYYSSIVSFLMRMGSAIRRDDEKGVYALVQDAAA